MFFSESAPAMPIMFAVKIVQLKAYTIFSQPMTLLFTQGHKCVKLDKCLTCTIIVISQIVCKLYMAFKHGMTVDLCIAYAQACVNDLDLDARSQWVGKGRNQP